MAIIAKYYDPTARPVFELAEEGQHKGIIVDVQDLGMQENRLYPGKMRHRIKILVELADAKDSKGRPIYVSKPYTVSLHPKSALSSLLKRLTGKAPTSDVRVDDLVLTAVEVIISHVKGQDGQTYQRIEEMWKGSGVMPSGHYKPWESGLFQVQSFKRGTTQSGKPYAALLNDKGEEYASLWADSDIAVVERGAKWIKCLFRENEEGQIRIKERTVSASDGIPTE